MISLFLVHFHRCRKLKKAMAVSGLCSWVPEENSGKVPAKLLEKISANREMLQILGFRAPGKATCREPWVDTAWSLSTRSAWDVFEIDSFSLLDFFLIDRTRIEFATPIFSSQGLRPLLSVHRVFGSQ